MAKLNCWEFRKCGREPNGANVKKLGICPATVEVSSTGIHGGKNAGRICWAVAGTFCGGKIQGDFAQELTSCMACNFFKTVKQEEGDDTFTLLKPGQKYVSTT